jgi:hypothetical protein
LTQGRLGQIALHGGLEPSHTPAGIAEVTDKGALAGPEKANH